MSRGADPHLYSRDGGRARYFAHFEPNDFNLPKQKTTFLQEPFWGGSILLAVAS
jgi:hypothetical protein